MNILQVDHLSKSFGEKTLFEDITLGLHAGSKTGLIARNGTGKSTLLKIIAGKEFADAGKVTFRSGLTVGYLDQEPIMDNTSTVIQQVYQWENPVIKLILEYEKAVFSKNRKDLDELILKMDSMNAWNYEVKIKQILTKLNITNLSQNISELSGGMKKRLALAGILILEPDIYILDEPTNHLDLGMIEWLEELLINTSSAVFMVTHDRYFLENICSEIIELDQKQLFSYKGNYQYYLEKREQRISQLNASVEKARNIYRKELEWVRRMPKARGTKSKYRIESFYELKRKASEKIIEDGIDLNLKTERLGKKVVELYNISKSYNGNILINDFTYLFKPYEKIGIVGNNGAGKTTFVEIIAGFVKPDNGHIEVGETVNIGYYSQSGIIFDENKKVIDVIKEISEDICLTGGKHLTASQYLYHFQFPEKMYYDYVYKLSGGEKRRLYLMQVLMKNPNFLILDEPTNDLDIVTLNILEEFLMAFQGCVIVVSHDRYFMDKITDHIFVFDGNGKIKDYPGTYSEYRIAQSKSITKELFKSTDIQSRQKNDRPRKLTYKEKKELDEIEFTINELENRKVLIEREISEGNLPFDQIHLLSLEHQQISLKIDSLTNRWIELSEFLT